MQAPIKPGCLCAIVGCRSTRQSGATQGLWLKVTSASAGYVTRLSVTHRKDELDVSGASTCLNCDLILVAGNCDWLTIGSANNFEEHLTGRPGLIVVSRVDFIAL